MALTVLLTLSACGGAGSPASATNAPTASPTPAPTVAIKDDAKLGKILVTPSGATLYIFKRDADNTSNCYDACATTWPAFVITVDPVAPVGMSGKLGIALRKDNAKQLTYNNQPLYLFANDKAAGDTNGEGVGGNWFTVAEIKSIAAGQYATVTANLAPGRYVVICNLPEHYELGMRAPLTVQ